MSDIQYISSDAIAASPIVRCTADATVSMPASAAPGQTVTVITGGFNIVVSGNGNTMNGAADGTGAAEIITCVYTDGNWVATGLSDAGAVVDIQ